MKISSRLAIFALLITIATSAFAQTDLHDWNNVKNIAPGSEVWVKMTDSRLTVQFESADDGALHVSLWRHRPFVGGGYSRPLNIPRDRVREVRFGRRGLSTLAGTAIGVAVGAGIGAGVDAQYPSPEEGHIATLLFGFLGGIFGEITGEHTAFIHGAKIYVAP